MISKDNVKYVAELARIHLREEEIEHLTTDLEKILQYINKLDTLDVGQIQGVLATQPLLDTYTVWAFSGSIAAWAIAVLNWLRAGRPNDKVIAAWALAGTLSWVLIIIWLAVAADMTRDIRIWLCLVVCGALLVFGLQSLRRAGSIK